ncbi:hypothetical protein EMCRGX_G024327 [Ephydatia muelleri]
MHQGTSKSWALHTIYSHLNMSLVRSVARSILVESLAQQPPIQKALSAKIDDFQFNQLFNSSSLADRARLLYISSPHASSWLLRDVVAELCRLAHLSVKVEAGNNLTPDHSHTRPADVLVQNWSRGRPAAFNICVTSPLNTLTLSEAGICAGAAAQAGEVRKHSANDDKCGDLG